MQTINIQKVLLMLVLLSAVSCKRDLKLDFDTPKPTTLPPITTSGENTFGCYINGELFVPYNIPDFTGGCGGAGGELGYGYYGESNQYFYLDINGYECSMDAAVKISLNQFFLDTGVYYLGYNNWEDDLHGGQNGAYYREGDYASATYGVCRGYCYITKFDTANKIVSGLFEFEVCNDSLSLQVTDGRFDVRYPY